MVLLVQIIQMPICMDSEIINESFCLTLSSILIWKVCVYRWNFRYIRSILEKEDGKGKGCETPEILSILGHELGHWKMNHTVKMLFIQEALIFGVFYTFR